MRDLTQLDKFRLTGRNLPAYFKGWAGDSDFGAFILSSPLDERELRVIASAGEGWDHVSVSRVDRCPDWAEMSFIKSQFFKPTETAVQFHVPESDHVNNHPYCLHLWRPMRQQIPRPPAWMVGPKGDSAL